MERYVSLKSTNELNNIFRPKKFLSGGSEGKAYLTLTKKVLKILSEYRDTSYYVNDDIIMAQDYNVKSFLLPETLFIVDGLIEGYITDYFDGNIFDLSSNNPLEFFETDERIEDVEHEMLRILSGRDIRKLNICDIMNAREELIEDVRTLTSDDVALRDVCSNLLFDGKRFGAIDTLAYYKDKSVTLDRNIKLIDIAILLELQSYDRCFKPDLEMSVEDNLKRIKK